MKNFYQLGLNVPMSLCDRHMKLAEQSIFALFMDVASVHGTIIGAGQTAMQEKGLFWLTVKTKVKFINRPDFMTDIKVNTWVPTPGNMSCIRNYEIRDDNDNVLCVGKTQWAVINTQTMKLSSCKGLYSSELESNEDKVDCGEFDRISEDFSDSTLIGTYVVCPTDIDLGGHMNNVSYIRTLMRFIDEETREKIGLNEFEAIFKRSCYEGDTLEIRLRETDGCFDYVMLDKNGDIVFIARIK